MKNRHRLETGQTGWSIRRAYARKDAVTTRRPWVELLPKRQKQVAGLCSNKSRPVHLRLAARGLSQMQTEPIPGQNFRGRKQMPLPCIAMGKHLGHWHSGKEGHRKPLCPRHQITSKCPQKQDVQATANAGAISLKAPCNASRTRMPGKASRMEPWIVKYIIFAI